MVFTDVREKNYQVLDHFVIFFVISQVYFSDYHNRKTIEYNFSFCFKPSDLGKDQPLYLCF